VAQLLVTGVQLPVASPVAHVFPEQLEFVQKLSVGAAHETEPVHEHEEQTAGGATNPALAVSTALAPGGQLGGDPAPS
jgi:hypothetical protein